MKTIKLISILALMLLTSVTANAQNSLVGDVNKDGRVNIADVTMVVDVILNGQKKLSLSATEISLGKGNTATIVITSGFGSYTVSCADTNIADASLSGSTVIITGKNVGTTVVKVIDTISGNMKEISVAVNENAPIAYPACPDENHPHLIDLGLPSGTKWACCNVGADKPEAYGGYYAFGETEEKEVYETSTYKLSRNKLYGNNNLDISGTEFDVAHVKWGGYWCMPTLDDIIELLDNCSNEWTTHNNVNGRKFTSKSNGSSIFLPATGYRLSGVPYKDLNVGTDGVYWSSTPLPDHVYEAYALGFGSYEPEWYTVGSNSDYGHSVRPVVRN